MNLINIYSKFSNVGGAQKMCLSLHKGLSQYKDFNKAFVTSFTDYDAIDESYQSIIKASEYLKFNALKLIKSYPKAIYISHHRKTTTLLVLASKFLNQKIKIVHVAHNEFTNLKYVTLFPKHVIAVSQGVKTNHENYFKLNEVHVIYNGLQVPKGKQRKEYNNNDIKVLVSGRIAKVKQQLEIVKVLKDKIPQNIQLWFAGTGELYQDLLQITEQNLQIRVLGHIDNMESVCTSVDYIMLCSLKEGMPLSLIEGASFGLPIICNDVGGNMEILDEDFNGFQIKNLEHLPEILKKISNLTRQEYQRLSDNSLKTFKEKFQMETMLSEYHNYILDEVVG